jgi:CO/xanthine dehydrogenase FAD-binding subunit
VTTQQDAVPAGRTPATVFEYQRAESWADAVELLGLWEGEAKILAGGQSLVPMLNLRLAFPGALIDVDGIPAGEPRLEGGHLLIDANTRHRVLTTSDVVGRHAPLLAHAARLIGNVRVRNRGTIGGSLAHADPTAEIGAVALALGGQIDVLGSTGSRTVAAEDFFVTYLTTALGDDEVVTGVRLPDAADARWGFHEVVRRYSDFATVSVSVLLRETHDLRVVLGGVADRSVLVDPALLAPALDDPGDPAGVRAAADAVAGSIDPDTDLHATADHRRRLVAVHTRRLLEQVLGADEGGTTR